MAEIFIQISAPDEAAEIYSNLRISRFNNKIKSHSAACALRFTRPATPIGKQKKFQISAAKEGAEIFIYDYFTYGY
ncbi:hypothetical protein [Chitinophaga niastensis]|uniref:hypothetical protein n=1 Tax=Chitinophaga niastensis TaxID=536980 RepID=UPI000D0CBEA6|nr:hypothetical protein [Chitinophaga niastensis]